MMVIVNELIQYCTTTTYYLFNIIIYHPHHQRFHRTSSDRLLSYVRHRSGAKV